MARAHYSKLFVDGHFGPVTILALQTYMRVKQGTYPYNLDGEWGPYTVRGLQRWMQNEGYYIGYRVDGTYGFYTKDQFSQMMRGIYGHITSYPYGAADLRISDPACKGLQRVLNYYRFV